MSVSEVLKRKGPRKLLALDGGGVRGMLTIEVLAEIEEILRRRTGGGKKFVLSDYFDYVAGTSTGAIIATCVSLGWSIDKIRRFYVDRGEEMFDKNSFLRRFHAKFDDKPLANLLKEQFGATTKFGSSNIKTLLMMVLRNASTDSPWPLSNNPHAKYNDPSRPDCNLKVPLWQLVRASTAAPVYFPPETVTLGQPPNEYDFVFVDGGVTTYNNPAFQLFLMSTVNRYALNWKAGEKDMLLVSVGTGTSPKANENLMPGDMNLLYNAGSIPSALMFAALNEQDLLCRVFGKCLSGDSLDLELGDLVKSRGAGPVSPKLFTYVRYNAELTKPGLRRLGITNIAPEEVQPLDSVKGLPALRRVGRAVARHQVNENHFDGFV